MLKVAKYSSGADEAAVAKISKRVPVKTGTSEGLHMVMLFIVEQVTKVTRILGKRR